MKTAEDILKEKGSEMIWVTEDTTISEALKKMVGNKIGAILVKKDDRFVGIWTERNLMRNTLLEDFDPNTAKVKDYMSANLRSAPAGDSLYMLMDKFLGMRLRHLLIEKNNKYIGLLSSGDVIKADLNEKSKELEKLNAMISWEYYENWKWNPQAGGPKT